MRDQVCVIHKSSAVQCSAKHPVYRKIYREGFGGYDARQMKGSVANHGSKTALQVFSKEPYPRILGLRPSDSKGITQHRLSRGRRISRKITHDDPRLRCYRTQSALKLLPNGENSAFLRQQEQFRGCFQRPSHLFPIGQKQGRYFCSYCKQYVAASSEGCREMEGFF